MSARVDHTPAVDRIGAEERRAALALVDDARVYDLGTDVDERMPPGPPEAFPRFARAWCASPGRQGGPFDFAAEVVLGAMHTSTHIDALVHVQKDGRIFGGELDADVRTDRLFKQHGVETIPPLLTRGLVLDVAGLHGTPALPDGYEIGVQDLQGALGHAGTGVRRGDVVLVRTGKIRDYHDKAATFHESAPGVGPDAAIWLYEQGMAALAVDTAGSEAIPYPDPERTTHVAMLVERGVHLIENVALDEVCADGVHEGLFVCLPLRITGATGSWVRPILVV
jgi:kynurenine formamidase